MQCDHSVAEIVEQSGGTKDGQFVERYECVCGAKGTIRGEASEPAEQWTRTGQVFNE